MFCGAYSQCKVYISFISLSKLWDILVASKEFNNISIYAFPEYFIHLKRWSHYRGSKVAYLVGKFILMYSQKSVYWYFSFVWRCYWYVLSILLTLPNGWGHIYNGGLMCGDTGKLDRSVQQQQQQHSLLSQASWGRLEMKPKRHKSHGSGTLIASLQVLLSKATSSEIF